MMFLEQGKKMFPSFGRAAAFVRQYGRLSFVAYLLAAGILMAITDTAALHDAQLSYKLHFFSRIEEQKCQEGILYYDYLTRIYPYGARTFYDLGVLYTQCHDPASAVKAFARAVALKPDEASYRQALEKSREDLKKK